ncbi:4'-phosphopantetheinyl transferase NpgA [Golovinomyces cichoracearum]|uniref:holo-[acyl-carrier-protein] synthase n=1 Tax=Golovinomyces cichoracearum TaxID=62708 RepID=A0A420IX61_9PEZI|nr:4'-phosphopantetheinyl transferase NpgA [Golovinomyces cichoracearum]
MVGSQEDTSDPKIVRWLLDTRPLWPVSAKAKTKEEVQELKNVASRALNLLPESEQASILRYHHIKDAKMSLASHLLKHLVITKYFSVPWLESTISHKPYGKPYFLHEYQNKFIDFNVSHQAGIVVLIAAISHRSGISVGTDVVCTHERRNADHAHVDKEGFFDWLAMYEDVFAESEIEYLRQGSLSLEEIGLDIRGATLTTLAKDVLSTCERRDQKISLAILVDGKISEIQVNSNVIIDAKIRKFYASWCLRETFIKMIGEAFTASWLKDLEILHVKPPKAVLKANGLEEGEVIKGFKIYLKKKKESTKTLVKNVMIDITSLGLSYMIAGAISAPEDLEVSGDHMGKWHILDLYTDIIKIAESSLNSHTLVK